MTKPTTNIQKHQQIFSDYAELLRDKNISFIPVKGKIPAIKKWTDYAKKEIPKKIYDSWLKDFPSCNIGVVTGMQSNLVAIDYDGDENNLLEELRDLIPASPVKRHGKKGWVQFYIYNGEVSRKFPHLKIEVFSNGGQVVIPPSIHPETKQPYKWNGYKSLYDVDMDDLGVLPDNFIEKLEKLEAAAKERSKLSAQSNGKFDASILGRNNTLFKACSKMVGDHVSRDVIAQELINLDKNLHETPWFSDPSEPHKGDVMKAVNLMIDRVASKEKDYTGKTILDGKNLLNPTNKKIKVKEIIEYQVPEVSFPEPIGVMKELCEYCTHTSPISRHKFSLGATVELMGILLCNKVGFFDGSKVHPANLYQLFISESGFGKDIPLNFPNSTLEKFHQNDYAGVGEYRSDKAMVKLFGEKRQRIDTIDEISSLFRSMGKGGSQHLSNMGEQLAKLYSSAGRKYMGMQNSEERVGACHSPCLGLIGSATPSSFSESFNSKILMQGLGGRFLYMYEQKRKKQKRLNERKRIDFPERAKEFIKFWGNMEIIKEDVSIDDIPQRLRPKGITSLSDVKEASEDTEKVRTLKLMFDKPVVKEFTLTEKAEDLYENLRVDEYHEIAENVGDLLLPVVNRMGENMVRLAQIHWAARTFDEVDPMHDEIELNEADIKWADQYVKASLFEASRLFGETIVHNEFEKDVVKVKKMLKKAANKTLSATQITRKFQHRTSDYLYNEKRGVLPYLIDAKLVYVIPVSEIDPDAQNRPGKQATYYRLIES